MPVVMLADVVVIDALTGPKFSPDDLGLTQIAVVCSRLLPSVCYSELLIIRCLPRV